jgi:ribulose-bisphosphate carboxylase large chain
LFPTSEFGIEGIREYTGVHNKPLLGGIIKPKTGMKPSQLLDMVKIMVENGVDFIKEDEILSNPHFCPLPKRIELVMDYLQGSSSKVIYTFCMNSDWVLLNEYFNSFEYQVTPGIHVNFWNGLGTYEVIAQTMIPLFLFFQKSGITILTNPNHDYHISWKVICKMAGLMGIDFIHAGMWGGYSHDDEDDLREVMAILYQSRIMPSLSCGMHPGLVEKVTEKFGVDYMANVGGAIHGHPGGTGAGVRAMRQAIDGNYGKEYNQAIDKWGKI